MHARAGAVESSVVAIEIGRRSEERKELVLAGELPAVEIRVLRSHGRIAGWWTQDARADRSSFANPNRSAEIGVAAEEFDLVLRLAGGGDAQGGREDNEKLEQQQQRER